MTKASTTLSSENKFLKRHTPLDLQEALDFEMGVFQVLGWTWVVLRESTNSGKLPVLNRHMEAVANSVRQELVYLRGMPDRLRFFHLHYEMAHSGQPQWAVKEVLFVRRDGLYALASWVGVSEETRQIFNEAWRLVEHPPQRNL